MSPEPLKPIETPYICVGRVKDAHSMHGEVFVRLKAGQADWFDDLDHVLLEKAAVKTRYEVLEKREHKDGLILVLEGVNDRTSAENLKGQNVEIPEDYLVSEPGEALYLKEILGCKIIDAKLGELGVVESFSSNGLQDLLVIKIAGKEHLIPFVEAFIQKLDLDAREIRTDLPDGLIEVC